MCDVKLTRFFNLLALYEKLKASQLSPLQCRKLKPTYENRSQSVALLAFHPVQVRFVVKYSGGQGTAGTYANEVWNVVKFPCPQQRILKIDRNVGYVPLTTTEVNKQKLINFMQFYFGF